MKTEEYKQFLDDQFDQLEALLKHPRPKGCFSTSEYAKKKKLPISTAKLHVAKLLALGKIERVAEGYGSRPAYYKIIT